MAWFAVAVILVAGFPKIPTGIASLWVAVMLQPQFQFCALLK